MLATPGTFQARSHPRAFPRARPFALTCMPPSLPALNSAQTVPSGRRPPCSRDTGLLLWVRLLRAPGSPFCWFYFLCPPLECKLQQGKDSCLLTALLSSSRSHCRLRWPPIGKSPPSLHRLFSFAFLFSMYYHPVYLFFFHAPR